MPFFEIRFLKELPEKYDIYDSSTEFESGSDVWDAFVPVDYKKLSRYIQI